MTFLYEQKLECWRRTFCTSISIKNEIQKKQKEQMKI